MGRKILRAAGPMLGVALFALALWALGRELRTYGYREIMRQLGAIPHWRLLLAGLSAACGYLVLTGYDLLALRYARRPLPYWKVAPASFIATAFSNNIGFSILSGGSVRYRLYSAEGIPPATTAKVVGFVAVSFWLGFFLLGGTVLVAHPPPLPNAQFSSIGLRIIGAAMLLVVAAYVALAVVRRRPLRLRGLELEPLSPRLFAAQVVLACLDWLFSAGTLLVLLPVSPAEYPALLGIYLIALIAGLVSQVPGGLGVFESMVVVFLAHRVPASQVLGALIAYRALYYLLPLALAVGLLALQEVARQRATLWRLSGLTARWTSAVVPSVVAFATFLSGLLLLNSGATPSVRSRIGWLARVIPLPVVEGSHFLASIAGVALILLARGLQQRLDAAYVFTLGLLGAGALFSVLKALDYEEALILTGMLAVLVACRGEFYRRASLLQVRFTPGWIGSVAVALLATTWLGFFAHRHVEYSKDLWWQFAFAADAPRFLRASVGVFGVALFAAGALLMRPSPPAPHPPSASELAAVRPLVAASRETYAHLALVGDKSLLINESRTAFLMYGREGRGWISMGDPIGEEAERRELVWRLRELADRSGGYAAYYQVSVANLPIYVDLGFSLHKLGEEASVPLEGFSLRGNERRGLRSAVNRFERDGYVFRVLPREEVPARLAEARAVSDAWLERKTTREKGFSLGYFDEGYLSLCPMAVVEREGQMIAFANLWLGAGRHELSVDLMRFVPHAPNGSMDYLFCQLMMWGAAQGYRWFNLGMAPFAGCDERALAPAWSRIASLVYRYGEHFYGFQGLRAYKEKFDPLWQARYLAVPRGPALPFILANLASLISGGLKGVVSK